MNQSWKDSGDSQLFHDGRMAEAPIAPVRGAGLRLRRQAALAELAREVWRERGARRPARAEADELRERFDEAFWCEERGGYYALALDGDKQRVDSLTSNIGHLLWSGIVPPERVDAIVDQLMGEELWSGWGVRTMSAGDGGFNPLAYHNGTVWPHDNSLIAWGLAATAAGPRRSASSGACSTRPAYFDHQLPEVFAGFSRTETPFPIAYPTAARPQAWAAGRRCSCSSSCSGCGRTGGGTCSARPRPRNCPRGRGPLRLTGVRAFDKAWDVQLEDGHVTIGPA